MKIGILTFHNVPNYGAMLQAYALKTYLSKLGHDVSIIDYRCPGNDSCFEPAQRKSGYTNSKNAFKKAVKWIQYTIFAEKAYSKKWKKFESFSGRYFNKASDEGLFEKYDLVFCGSDQIWNPQITKNFRGVYFGEGKGKFTKVASYAASCGDINELDASQKRELVSLIKNLDFVGVREKGLKNFIQNENINAEVTLDPTFLLSNEEYINELSLQKGSDEKYLLQYSLQNDRKLDELALEISKSRGLKIIKVSGYLVPSGGDSGKFDVGPEEFLQYLYNAEYVATNSFHGTAFSLGFEKDFSVLLPAQRKGRVVDLLSSLSLENRICSDEKNSDFSSIDYKDVNQKLGSMTADAKKYITRVLESCDE